MPFPLVLTLLLPLFGVAAPECSRPQAGFEDTKEELLDALDELAGHIRNTQCLVASCDPTGSNDGRCYSSSHQQVIAAQGRFAAKVQKLQTNKAALKAALDRYSAQLKNLGKAPLPKVEAGLACRGAVDATKSVITEREAPLKELVATMIRLRSRQLLVEELNEMNRTFQSSVAQLRPRPYTMGIITVNLPCQPNLAQEYIRTKEKLETSVKEITTLEANLVAEECIVRGMRTDLEATSARCDTNAPSPVVAGTGANSPGGGRADETPPASCVPSRTGCAKKDPPPTVAGTPERRDPPPVVAPPRRDPPEREPGSVPASVKDPDHWGRLTREDWKKKDEYMQAIQAPMPRLYSTDESLKSFLDQARTSNHADYALRVQAAVNATAVELNGDSVGSAPTVYQDGLIGSRTRGAVDYYLRNQQAREAFLRNLAAYGIKVR